MTVAGDGAGGSGARGGAVAAAGGAGGNTPSLSEHLHMAGLSETALELVRAPAHPHLAAHSFCIGMRVHLHGW